jgi:hypothetical protein
MGLQQRTVLHGKKIPGSHLLVSIDQFLHFLGFGFRLISFLNVFTGLGFQSSDFD